MNPKYEIGDIVAVNSHPYFENLTKIIASGDTVLLSPLMVVIEILKIKEKVKDNLTLKETYRYTCIWFSTKSCQFNNSTLYENDIKLIKKNISSIFPPSLKAGARAILKTAEIEISKKRSSVSYEDNSITEGNGQIVINPLLSFISPIIQIKDVFVHAHKLQLTEKKSTETIRMVWKWSLKGSYFNPVKETISEITIPLESLSLIEDVELDRLAFLTKVIKDKQFLNIEALDSKTLIKPKTISQRNGSFYLRGFDYITNNIQEFKIDNLTIFAVNETPFVATAPSFDILSKPQSGTADFIKKEIESAIKKAEENKNFIRFKYKNRNDLLSHRTIKNFQVAYVVEDKIAVAYVIGYCMSRRAIRAFRIDRIQNFEELHFVYI